MERNTQITLLLFLILGLGLVYVGQQVNVLQNRVNELDYLIIETGVTIDNGADTTTKTVNLTRGATPIEALQRVAAIETETYTGLGTRVTTINGVSDNKKTGTYWLIAKKSENENSWIGVTKPGRDELKDGDNLLFWYGKPSNAPFEAF